MFSLWYVLRYNVYTHFILHLFFFNIFSFTCYFSVTKICQIYIVIKFPLCYLIIFFFSNDLLHNNFNPNTMLMNFQKMFLWYVKFYFFSIPYFHSSYVFFLFWSVNFYYLKATLTGITYLMLLLGFSFYIFFYYKWVSVASSIVVWVWEEWYVGVSDGHTKWSFIPQASPNLHPPAHKTFDCVQQSTFATLISLWDPHPDAFVLLFLSNIYLLSHSADNKSPLFRWNKNYDD